jgi:hypothetical protein
LHTDITEESIEPHLFIIRFISDLHSIANISLYDFLRYKCSPFSISHFEDLRLLYVPPALTFKIILGTHTALIFCVRRAEQTATLRHTTLTDWLGITEVESVLCDVPAESLYKTETFHHSRVNISISYRQTLL